MFRLYPILCGALVAGIVAAAPPGANAPTATLQPPAIEIIALASFKSNDPSEYLLAGAEIPITDDERKAGRQAWTPLGAQLPAPNQDWHLAEVSTSPPYIVVRHVRTGQRTVIWQKQPANPPAVKPIPLPVPPPPGIGCIHVTRSLGLNAAQAKEWHALLTGGAYTGDAILGYYRQGQRLPKPWDKWRVSDAQEFPVATDHGRFAGGYCVICNDATGQSVRLPVKQLIDLPHDAPIPATQPAE